MKKMFLFAAAAMVSLSSCVQTDEIYTGKSNEMGFKSAVTRGIIQTNDEMTYPVAVTAVWDDTKNGEFANYFEKAKFVYDAGTGLWKGEPARYWPTSGDMQFLGLCPYPISNVTHTYKINGELVQLGHTLTVGEGAGNNNCLPAAAFVKHGRIAVVAAVCHTAVNGHIVLACQFFQTGTDHMDTSFALRLTLF